MPEFIVFEHIELDEFFGWERGQVDGYGGPDSGNPWDRMHNDRMLQIGDVLASQDSVWICLSYRPPLNVDLSQLFPDIRN